MKLIKIGLFAILFFNVANVHAGCLDGISTTYAVVSRVLGLYVNPGTGNSYVVLDKENCTAEPSGDRSLTSNTRNYHYLWFSNSDKVMIATLLAAKANEEIAYMRVGSEVSGGFNRLEFIASPASSIGR